MIKQGENISSWVTERKAENGVVFSKTSEGETERLVKIYTVKPPAPPSMDMDTEAVT